MGIATVEASKEASKKEENKNLTWSKFLEEFNNQKAILTSLEERVEDIVIEVEKDLNMKENCKIGKDFHLDKHPLQKGQDCWMCMQSRAWRMAKMITF